MNNLVKKNESLKCGFVIRLLSVIALVCMILSSVSYFFYYDYNEINGEWVYKLTFRFPDFMNLISLLLSRAPFVLFVLYIFKYHNKLKATVLVPIIFGILAFEILLSLLTTLNDMTTAIYAIETLISLFAYILALISALKGFNKKIYVIIAMSVCLFMNALGIVGVFLTMNHYIANSMYLYIFTSLTRIIGDISFYVALLLFALKNKIPAIISVSAKKESLESMNPKQALRVLKDKLDLGMITEEEYQAQRTEIISKL